MLKLKDAVDEKTLVIIQKMFMQFLHSSTALYEADGTYVYSNSEGQYCSYLYETSCKHAGCCIEESLNSGKWICHEDCMKISRASMERLMPVEMECTGGINIYAVPIIYNGKVIGSINAAITNPPLERVKLESIAKLFNIEVSDLMQGAYSYKRLTHEEIGIARMQIRMAALLISSLYETKLKQIQAEKEVKRQILKAERAEKKILENTMKMKDEFLATITHEFKTPLTVINAAIQAINSLYGKQIPEGVRKHIERIRMNSFRQLRLVNNLLDISRFNSGHIKLHKQNLDIVHLTRAITESVTIFAQQKEVNLYFLSEIEYKEMYLDDEKFERVLLNLLSNAIKFTPKGKSIHVNLSCKNRKIIIIVKDEGVGIPKNKQKFIFERFGQVDSSLTRQSEGSGIGLSLVKALVSAIGGSILLDSEVGKGSTFTLILPITKQIKKACKIDKLQQTNDRIMQSAEVEFSDIYLN